MAWIVALPFLLCSAVLHTSLERLTGTEVEHCLKVDDSRSKPHDGIAAASNAIAAIGTLDTFATRPPERRIGEFSTRPLTSHDSLLLLDQRLIPLLI